MTGTKERTGHRPEVAHLQLENWSAGCSRACWSTFSNKDLTLHLKILCGSVQKFERRRHSQGLRFINFHICCSSVAQPNQLGSRNLNDGNECLEQGNCSHVIQWTKVGNGRKWLLAANDELLLDIIHWPFHSCKTAELHKHARLNLLLYQGLAIWHWTKTTSHIASRLQTERCLCLQTLQWNVWFLLEQCARLGQLHLGCQFHDQACQSQISQCRHQPNWIWGSTSSSTTTKKYFLG